MSRKKTTQPGRNLFLRACIDLGAVHARIGEGLGISQSRVTQISQGVDLSADAILEAFGEPVGQWIEIFAHALAQQSPPRSLEPFAHLGWINAETVRECRQMVHAKGRSYPPVIDKEIDLGSLDLARAAAVVYFVERALGR